MNKKEKKF